jgi:hypothetical protein
MPRSDPHGRGFFIAASFWPGHFIAMATAATLASAAGWSRPLPDGQPYARAMLNCRCEDLLRFAEIAAREKQAVNLAAIARPLLYLVEVTMVGNQRLVGFFVGPIGHLVLWVASILPMGVGLLAGRWS